MTEGIDIQGHGLVQLIPLIIIECIVFVSFCAWRPFANRGSNVLVIFISFFKIAAYAILVTFSVNVKLSSGIILAVLGFVILAIQSVMTVILFIVTIYNLGAGLLWARSSRREAEEENRKMMSMSEKRGIGPLLSASIVGGGDDAIELRQPPPVSSLYTPVPSSSAPSHDNLGTPKGSMFLKEDQSQMQYDRNTSYEEANSQEAKSTSTRVPLFWQKNESGDANTPQNI